MRKRLLLLSLLVATSAATLFAQGDGKPQVKVGGLFLFNAYYDSYKMIENRHGAQVSYPAVPNFGADGRDLNKYGQFGMTVQQTRLNVSVTNLSFLNSDARVYVETDFMGTGNEFYQLLRLRHAYVDMQWERDGLLVGQTENVISPEELTPGVFTSGAGSPIRILSRPLMVRYNRSLTDRLSLYAAISYNLAMPMAGPTSVSGQQRNSSFPGIDARVQWSDGVWFAGVGGSYKVVRPRVETDSDTRATTTIGSAAVTGFLRYTKSGYSFKAQAVYGGNLSNLLMIGGYAKLLDDQIDGDYGYANLPSWSVWGDFETRSFCDWRFGVFAGYMATTGASSAIDPSVMYARDASLSSTGRVSPRVTFGIGQNALVGAEYSLYWASWGKVFDSNYKAEDCYPTARNNRVTLLFRYKF